MDCRFALTNYQNWEICGSVKNGKHNPTELRHSNHREIIVCIERIGFIWSETVKKSKKIPYKTLQRELRQLNQSQDSHGFEVVLREEGIYVVFDKSRRDQIVEGKKLGAVAFLTGCACAISGLGLPAAVFWGAGLSGFSDAATKDIVTYDSRENLNQSLFGAASAFATGGFQSLLSPVTGVARQFAQKSAVSLLKYGFSELNGNKLTLKGAATTIVSDVVVGTGLNRLFSAGSVQGVAGNVLKSGAERAVSAASSQVIHNVAEGDKKNWYKGVSFASFTAMISGMCSALPNAVQENAAQEQKVAQQQLEQLKRQEEEVIRRRFFEADALFGKTLVHALGRGREIDGEMRHAPQGTKHDHKNNDLNKIAKGETISLKHKGGGWIEKLQTQDKPSYKELCAIREKIVEIERQLASGNPATDLKTKAKTPFRVAGSNSQHPRVEFVKIPEVQAPKWITKEKAIYSKQCAQILEGIRVNRGEVQSLMNAEVLESRKVKMGANKKQLTRIRHQISTLNKEHMNLKESYQRALTIWVNLNQDV